MERFFGITAEKRSFFSALKLVDVSPDEAFVEDSFGLTAIDLLDCCCFYFAVGIKNVDDVAADDRDRVFFAVVGIFDRKVNVFHNRSPVLYWRCFDPYLHNLSVGKTFM